MKIIETKANKLDVSKMIEGIEERIKEGEKKGK
jgi:hypothetical protein